MAAYEAHDHREAAAVTGARGKASTGQSHPKFRHHQDGASASEQQQRQQDCADHLGQPLDRQPDAQLSCPSALAAAQPAGVTQFSQQPIVGQQAVALPADAGSESFLPDRNAEYLQVSYWDKRFRKEASYEWFKGYADFRHLLLPHLQSDYRILILGCGNSALGQDLYLEGFTKITNVDLSPVVIERMKAQAQAAQQTEMQWRVADMLDLPFADATFDVVLEKGTMDVLFVDNDSPWDPLPEVKQRVVQMLAETHRVLSPHGCFVSITFAQPHFRRPFLLAPQFSWSMKYDTFGETFHYFVYTMEKGARTEADLLENQPGYTATAPHLTESMLHEHMDEEDYLLHMQL